MGSDPFRGFTLVELLMVVALLAVILAVAIPWYRGARRAGDEATALSTLETVNTAQAAFKAICGNGRYAPDLPALGTPVPASGESFLSADLTSGTQVRKAGYIIQMVGEPVPDAPAACNGAAVATGYAATADPVVRAPGARFFGTNASGAIYEHSETLTGTMPESGPAPAGREIGHD
jgi:prepilin-type N-terminal cleavage/methylation domain-containing protein